MFRALLWDFDGLILDTETPDVVTWQELFAEHGLEFPDWCWIGMIGRRLDTAAVHPLDLLEQELGRTVDRDALSSRRRARRKELIDQNDTLPGVRELLSDAKAAGLRVAVVSSSDRKWLENHLDRIGLLDEFEFLSCGYEGLPSKPDPALYVAALDRLGFEPGEVVTLEDSPNGIAAAVDAGIWTIAVPNFLTDRLDLSRAHCRVESLLGLGIDALFARLPKPAAS